MRQSQLASHMHTGRTSVKRADTMHRRCPHFHIRIHIFLHEAPSFSWQSSEFPIGNIVGIEVCVCVCGDPLQRQPTTLQLQPYAGPIRTVVKCIWRFPNGRITINLIPHKEPFQTMFCFDFGPWFVGPSTIRIM